MVLPSRRFFNTSFSADPTSRAAYASNLAAISERSQPVHYFTQRLTNIQTHNKTEFNSEMSRLVNPPPKFIIERADKGKDYLKIWLPKNESNSSKELEEGLINLCLSAIQFSH